MILRKIEDVETIDVGKPFGMPDGSMLIQWIVSNEVGDERYWNKGAGMILFRDCFRSSPGGYHGYFM